MEPQSTSSHEGPETYRYTSLDESQQEIRLLTLLPGQFSSEIRVCLDVARFTHDQAPKFEAVSYTWGSAENPVDIFIRNSGNKTLSVTQNLAEALPYFRFEDKPRVLWVDAICVDQQNLGERGHQVRRMADIYSRAAKVLIWLGPEAQNSHRAIQCLNLIASKVKFDWNTRELSATTGELNWADRNIAPPLVDEDWISLYHFVHRPWFERLWVRQEVNLASVDPALMCGHQTMSWTSLCHAAACLWIKPTGTSDKGFIEHFQARLRIVFDLCDGRRDMDLGELIASTKHCACSDPRDRIYSLLSLASRQAVCEIEPDYTKSVYEVYRDTVLSTIRTTKFNNLDILTTVEADECGQKVSSWVPNLSSPRKADPLSLGNASSNTMHTLSLETNRLNLTVEGLLIGVVDKVHLMPSFDSYSNISDIQDLKRIATFALSLEYPLQAHELKAHQLKAFCRTVTINNVSERFSPAANMGPSVIQIEELMKDLLESTPKFESDIIRIRFKTLRALFRVAKIYCKGRSFFLSREGKFGLGPCNARPGDLVAVLLGCYVPMVLRTCVEGGYQVVGEAYYDGFMDGEALLGSIPEPYSVRYRYDGTESWNWNYLNQETGLFKAEDPRLGPLPSGWSVRYWQGEDFRQWIVNGETGETACPDPRLTSEALRERGVPLQEIMLI